VANRYRKVDANNTTAPDSTPLRKTTADAAHGQKFTCVASGNILSVRLWLKRIGSPSGDVWVEIYADGADPQTGSLLGTSDTVAAGDIGTSFEKVYFDFQSPVAITATTQYYIVVKGDWTIDGSNYLSNSYDNSENPYDGGTFWLKDSGTGWSEDANQDAWFEVLTDANGGAFDLDTSIGVHSLDALKGGNAPHVDDTIYIFAGAILAAGDASSLSCKQIRLGETSEGAASASERYGLLMLDKADFALTFKGDATYTNSGVYSNPASADASSKNSICLLHGSDGHKLVMDNSVAAANTSYRWTIHWVYGEPLDIDYVELRNCWYRGITFYCSATYVGTPGGITLDHMTVTGLGQTNAAVLWPQQATINKVSVRGLEITVPAGVANYGINGANGPLTSPDGEIDMRDIKFTRGGANSSFRAASIEEAGGDPVYSDGFRWSFTDIRGSGGGLSAGFNRGFN